jgi:hypothetical protein
MDELAEVADGVVELHPADWRPAKEFLSLRQERSGIHGNGIEQAPAELKPRGEAVQMGRPRAVVVHQQVVLPGGEFAPARVVFRDRTKCDLQPDELGPGLVGRVGRFLEVVGVEQPRAVLAVRGEDRAEERGIVTGRGHAGL